MTSLAAATQGRGSRVRAWVWLAACCLGGAVAPEAAGEAPVTDDAVMAAFIYNFGKFAEWPDSSAGERSGRFEICVTGVRDDLRKALGALQGKSVQGREVTVRPLAKREESAGCAVLVVAERERTLGDWLKAVQGRPILTVGDGDGFLDAGGMISLNLVDDKVRFDINLDPVREANLKLSSHLLKLARSVRGARR
jgi:hypothetical protein